MEGDWRGWGIGDLEACLDCPALHWASPCQAEPDVPRQQAGEGAIARGGGLAGEFGGGTDESD